MKSNVTQNNESTSIWAQAGCPLNHEVIQHVILVSSDILKISKSVKLHTTGVIFALWKKELESESDISLKNKKSFPFQLPTAAT